VVPVADLVANDSYRSLRNDITQLLEAGKNRAARALEDELVKTYHAVGKQMSAHLDGMGDESTYGAQLVERLAADVGLGIRLLYDCLRFCRQFPILPTSTDLGWSHLRVLFMLPTPALRDQFLQTAVQEGWTVRELRDQVQKQVLTEPKPVRTPRDHLPPLRGRLYTYKRQIVDDAARLDLGFHISRSWPKGVSDAPVVHSILTPDGVSLVPTQGRRDTFYTYRATLQRVIDGDTLWVNIDCGFDTWTDQKLRLRGIDTPEMDTPEGQRARRFVEGALRKCPVLAITTTKPDKYDRYLADVFYLPGENDVNVVLEQGLFLNRELIEVGLAKRV
jgi:endonuclease YncB( thermonuclease family)